MSEGLVLDDPLQEVISLHCRNGDGLAAEGRGEEAVAEYNKAWMLVPEPRNAWEASAWILAAIADCCFLLGKWNPARNALDYAMTCPGAIGNPFLHLRRGQVLFEQDEAKAAANGLMRAFMAGGQELFEDQDGKYLRFLESRIDETQEKPCEGISS